MFSVRQKREIADAVQAILRATNHPELPEGEIVFKLHVEGAEPWSFADIRNNGVIIVPMVNPWNEAQDTQRTDPPKNVDERFESLAAEYASLYHESQTRTLCEPHHFEDVQQKNERWYRDCVGQGFDPNKVARHGIELYKRPPQVHDKP